MMRRLATPILVAAALACTDAVAPAPSAPGGITATLSAATTVQLSWDARPSAERIASYVVYRSGQKIGESTTTTFVDSSLAENVTLEYSVSSLSENGEESPRSAVASVTTRDATPPRIIQNFPANGAGPLPVFSAPVTVVFSEAMDSASVVANFSVTVASSGAPVGGTMFYNPRLQTAEFRPLNSSGMPAASTIVVRVGSATKDLSGNSIGVAYTYSFTTTENSPPVIVSTNPANEATGIPVDLALISVTFNERMSPFISAALFDTNLGSLIPMSQESYDTLTNTVYYRVRETLRSNHRFAVDLEWTGPVTDISGNRLAGQKSFTFTTVDAGPPRVVSLFPGSNATGVDPATQIRVTYDEPLDPTTINATNYVVFVSGTGERISASVSYDPQSFSAVFTPVLPLAPATTYSVFLTNVRDATGVAAESPASFLFTTRP